MLHVCVLLVMTFSSNTSSSVWVLLCAYSPRFSSWMPLLRRIYFSLRFEFILIFSIWATLFVLLSYEINLSAKMLISFSNVSNSYIFYKSGSFLSATRICPAFVCLSSEIIRLFFVSLLCFNYFPFNIFNICFRFV